MADKSTPVSVVVAAAGTATATLINYGPYTWLVKQVGIEMPNAGSGATGVIRKGGNVVTPFVAQLDAPSGEPFIPLYPNEKMTVEWASATPGAIGVATFYYDDGVPG